MCLDNDRCPQMQYASFRISNLGLPFSFIQKIGHKFARIPFDTVPHKSHAINIDFSIAFCYLYVLSGISVLSGIYMHRCNPLSMISKLQKK